MIHLKPQAPKARGYCGCCLIRIQVRNKEQSLSPEPRLNGECWDTVTPLQAEQNGKVIVASPVPLFKNGLDAVCTVVVRLGSRGGPHVKKNSPHSFLMTGQNQWKRETWWWNMKVDEAVKEKRRCFKVWSRLKKQKVCGDARKATRAAYDTAKKHAKRVVWLAKQDAAKDWICQRWSHGPWDPLHGKADATSEPGHLWWNACP